MDAVLALSDKYGIMIFIQEGIILKYRFHENELIADAGFNQNGLVNEIMPELRLISNILNASM